MGRIEYHDLALSSRKAAQITRICHQPITGGFTKMLEKLGQPSEAWTRNLKTGPSRTPDLVLEFVVTIVIALEKGLNKTEKSNRQTGCLKKLDLNTNKTTLDTPNILRGYTSNPLVKLYKIGTLCCGCAQLLIHRVQCVQVKRIYPTYTILSQI